MSPACSHRRRARSTPAIRTASGTCSDTRSTRPRPAPTPTRRWRAAGRRQTQVTHSAALLLWLTGLEVESVTAAVANFELEVDLVDAAAVRFANGALGSLASTGSVTGGHDEILEYRIFGSQGHVLFDVNGGTASVHGADGSSEQLPPLAPEHRYPEWAPANNLVDIVLGRAPNGSPAEIGVAVVELVDAIYRSARQGRSVRIAEPGGRSSGSGCVWRVKAGPRGGVRPPPCGDLARPARPDGRARPVVVLDLPLGRHRLRAARVRRLRRPRRARSPTIPSRSPGKSSSRTSSSTRTPTRRPAGPSACERSGACDGQTPAGHLSTALGARRLRRPRRARHRRGPGHRPAHRRDVRGARRDDRGGGPRGAGPARHPRHRARRDRRSCGRRRLQPRSRPARARGDPRPERRHPRHRAARRDDARELAADAQRQPRRSLPVHAPRAAAHARRAATGGSSRSDRRPASRAAACAAPPTPPPRPA